MANLIFYYSTMNAGKTIDLIKTAFNFESEKIHVVIFTSYMDTRSGDNKIRSRMGMEKEAISIKQEDDLFKKIESLKITPGCVLIDEVQFFTVEQIWQLFHVTHKLHIPVVCYGLRGDFMGKPFPASAQLMAIANKVEEIRTICWCGRKAIMNARIIDEKMVREGEQFMVGGNESYKVLCGIHWLSGQYKKK
ncbi:MAG TPA: thymidine kinase [Candidatus Absconditabacterales bacterium]|nr:thymidine kinase [Candidatus Absconditabacterales bacterium]